MQHRAYEKTVRGFLMRLYRNMLSRVQGRVKPHLYKGLPILPKEEFYRWAIRDHAFVHLFRVWKEHGYDRRLTPSINRVDSREGYVLSNIEFLTNSANSSLGARSQVRHSAVRAAIERLVKEAA